MKAIGQYESVAACVSACFGSEVKIEGKNFVGGGDINESRCLLLSNGARVFVKENTLSNYGFFEAEEYGLGLIAETQAIRTPKLLGRGLDRSFGTSFLMMEMIEPAPRAEGFWEEFGRELAKMHSADTKPLLSEGRFGLDRDNYIGAGKQINTPKDTWVDFFRECRLAVQLHRAERYFDQSLLRLAERLLERLEDRLIEPEQPALLHGDLWSGNFITGSDGKAWLIDPAVYIGHPEADLAMTELFGRFHPSFYQSYHEVKPLQAGYEERRDLYNLYHLLNHLNLFGASYLSSVSGIIRRYA